MKINYKDADGKLNELEVSDEVGTFYLESIDTEKKTTVKTHALTVTHSFQHLSMKMLASSAMVQTLLLI